MRTNKGLWFFLCCLIVFTFSLSIPSVSAVKMEELSSKEFAELARGGLLYDNWPSEVGAKIEKTHPSYPSVGRKKGASTWRCKECHGWDYMGKAGAYSKGGHYTGIKGIRAYANKDPEALLKVLKDSTHAFGKMMPEKAYRALALFVSAGQIDMDSFIDRATKKAKGDPANGARIYLTICTKCHGEDGRDLNFKDEKKPEYIGTVANKNPWEVLHKIRWGHPGSTMPSLIVLDPKDQADVLSYCQTLPGK